MSAIMIDPGSFSIKAGFSNEHTPGVVMRSIVGRPRHQGVMTGVGQKDKYFGNEALEKRGILTLEEPLMEGSLRSFDADQLLSHIFEQLGADPSQQSLLLAEEAANPTRHRSEAAHVMFETFNVPRFQLFPSAICACYTSTKSTGLVVDLGHSKTRVTPVIDGCVVPNASKSIEVGGKDITLRLGALLNQKPELQTRNLSFSTSGERELVREFMEQHASAQRIKWKPSRAPTAQFELPDGQVIELGNERYMCTEPLLRANESSGWETADLAYTISQALEGQSQLDISGLFDGFVAKELRDNIVLVGGCSKLNGLVDRLKNDISGKTTIHALPDRELLVWRGGAIVAEMPAFQEQWITKAKYDEVGPDIMRRGRRAT
eukprot:TRINITY_DN12654_c2_g8_i1.p1 TRINITY_DN12654_c2_g8~~TRINITY_DN12654_c2_g8_i1.p1  ORF type:complete len:376 (+),score=82.42 TRINITY_DN12654_c2_g8_i1:494-1621(+)